MPMKQKLTLRRVLDGAVAALAADSPLHHFSVQRLLADNVGAVVS